VANSQQGDRTEKPTAKRRRDARKRGQVARSRDLAGAVALVAATVALAWLGEDIIATIGSRLASGLEGVADARGEFSVSSLGATLWSDLWIMAAAAGPLALVAASATTVTSLAQTGWVFSPKALELKWDRLSPAAGFAKFSPKQGGAELVKTIIGLTVVLAVCLPVIRDLYITAPAISAMSAVEAGRFGWNRLWELLWRTSVTLAVLAGADYGLQYWRWFSQVKMTRREVRDEFKANEGDPDIKARVRRVQREMTRRRMLQAVKGATVVITNPTHFAVALKYDRTEMPAPVIVAKGQDHMAARIKKVAADHGVPVVENVTLARALYRDADVGDVIPGPLFGAVAEVLAYLVRLKQLVL
jgi:flagellar biosynthetic protein FlhB